MYIMVRNTKPIFFLSRVSVHNGDLVSCQCILGMAKQESFLMYSMFRFFYSKMVRT